MSILAKRSVWLFDGAFGTYYASLFTDEESCEMANLKHPERVLQIHKEYIHAGAHAIKTNTFSANEQRLECDKATLKAILRSGYKLAKQAADGHDVEVFADIGPIVEQRNVSMFQQYQELVDVFLEEGAKNFLFETFSSDQGIAEISSYIKKRCENACVIVSFAVTADGYTRQGIALHKLLQHCRENPDLDAFGLNCICGPMHMRRLLQHFDCARDAVSISPNAGYPTLYSNRTYYRDNSTYFAQEMMKLRDAGVRILGGCCGTTPHYIEKTAKMLKQEKEYTCEKAADVKTVIKQSDRNPIRKKLEAKKKVIAVEFDPPADCNIERFMNNAQFLREQGVDAITIADCPIARARMDSSLLACKLHREMGLDVIPHLTCRDRNINATKALLYGLEIEDIHNVLIVTGDPIPAEERNEIKGVFNFNSKILAGYIRDLNQSLFEQPFMIFGALNLNAVNFHYELEKAKQKINQGVEAFLTQPVHSRRALENLKMARQELGVYLFGGILPIVSYNNARYMNNEVSGIEVDESIIERYEGKNRAEAQQLAISISCAIADAIKPYIDGYYLITPFYRVEIIADIISHIREK